jgi:hypothetical protein
VKPAYVRQRAKKKLFAAWRLCAQKIKYLEEEKLNFLLTPNNPPRRTREK